jgi:multicopper oxidase
MLLSLVLLAGGIGVFIRGHVTSAGVDAPLNGHRYVVRSDDSNTILRIRGAGAEFGMGEGGEILVWRLHKSSIARPELQNNGASGAYVRVNPGERVNMRWFNGGTMTHPIHVHGHQWAITARDGNLLGLPYLLNLYNLPAGGTVDALLVAKNPNTFGAWAMHCHNLNHISNPDNPWPNGRSYPGGMLTVVDYTGGMQGRKAVTDDFRTMPFKILPPSCSAGRDRHVVNILYIPSWSCPLRR